MKNHKDKSGMTRNFIKLMLCTLSVTSSPYFLHAMEPVHIEPAHTTSSVADMYSKSVGPKQGQPSTANLADMYSKNVENTQGQQSSSITDAYLKNIEETKNLETKKQQIKSENKLKRQDGTKTAFKTSVEEIEMPVTHEGKYAINPDYKTTVQEVEMPTTHEGLALGSKSIPTTSTEIVEYKEPKTTSTKNNLFADNVEQEIVLRENIMNEQEEILDIEEYNRLQEQTEVKFQEDPKAAAEYLFTTVDPDNIIEESDRVELVEEFEKGPKKGHSWSEWFKSIYQKIVDAFNKAFKIKNSKKSSGKKSSQSSEPFATKPASPVTTNIDISGISNEGLDALYKDLEEKAYNARSTGKKLSPDQQEMLNFLRERDKAQGK